MAQQMRLPPFMKAETMSVVTPSRSKGWRSYNVWPPQELQKTPPQKIDEDWEMVKSGVFTEGETFDLTVDTLYNHETRVTEIDRFLVKRRMREERCYHREIALADREKVRKVQARELLQRKHKLYEENRARDAVIESYATFKKNVDTLQSLGGADSTSATEQIKSQREFANMSSASLTLDLSSLMSDVAMGSGNILYARSIHAEVVKSEMIARDIASTLTVAQQKNYHRAHLGASLSKVRETRLARHLVHGIWIWEGPRGSSPRRAAQEGRAAKMFQSRWRGYALRTADSRASSVMTSVDERSHTTEVFSAAAMRMFSEKKGATCMFDPRSTETARHIRMLARNQRKFEAAGRRLGIVEVDWRRRASMCRQHSFQDDPQSKAVIHDSLLEEGMALAKERAVVEAAVRYTAACILQRFARMLLVDLVDYVPTFVVENSAPRDLRRNKSRLRIEKLQTIKQAKQHKKMVFGFTMFQRRVRHFLTHSVVERAARDAIGRLVVRRFWRTKGAEMMEALRTQRREFLSSAVSSTVATVRKRLETIMRVWRLWAREQGQRRLWLSGRDARRRVLIIEEMLYGRLILKRQVRAAVLRDMGGSMTKVLTKYKQSKWDWCSLLTALDDEFQRVDPNGAVASRILPVTSDSSTLHKERMRKLQGMRSPFHPHIALVYLLSASKLHRRVAVPPRKHNPERTQPKVTKEALFPAIVASPASSLVKKPATLLTRHHLSTPKAVGTWETLFSDELMFASELMPKQAPAASSQRSRKLKLKVGGGEEEMEARRKEARADDAHVHRHLTVPLWRFLGSCGEFFEKCSANSVSRDEANSIAEEREMLDAFLGMFFEVRQESLPYLELDRAPKKAMKNNQGLFWRWLHECEYCPRCFCLATHPTGEGYGVADWTDPLRPRPPKRRCPSCHTKFISRCRANTGAVASRLRSQAGISSQNVPSVAMVIEPVSSLFLHAALAVLAPVGSWRRSRGLSEVWGQALELAKPVIERALAANISTVADLAARRSTLRSLTEEVGVREHSEEDALIDKTLGFLATLDELILRRAAERKRNDLALILDSTSFQEEHAKQAQSTRQSMIEAARIERTAVSETWNTTARSISFSKNDELSASMKASQEPGTRTPTTAPRSTRLHSATSQHPRFTGSDDVPENRPGVSKSSPKKKKGHPKGMFRDAEYRVRPMVGSLYG